MLVRQRASALVARVFGSCMHLKHPSTVDVHPVVLKKIDFDITTEDIEKFDNNVENLQKFNGVPGVLCALKVDPSKGIDASEEDLKSRQDAFGSNTYPIKQNKPFWMFVWEALQDETLIILMACAAVALIIGFTTMDPAKGWYDGGGIAFAIVLVVLVSSTSNYKQSLQFQELNAEKRKIHINVTRQGRRKKILIFDLLVGDIVHLGIGDQVPADGILIKGHSLVIDESSMTGESDPVSKDEEKPFFLSGCKVIDGFGVMLVTAVGMRTEWGKVMATLTEDDDEETPLQVRLNHLATIIGKIGMTVAIVVFLVLIIRLLASEVNFKHFTAENGRSIVDFFSVAVTIVVVAVPEGLPLAVTLALAYSMHKMMDDRALVRHLSACETMGSATTICSDKTGTLTQNVMTVVKSWVCGKLRDHTMLDHGLGDEHRKIFFDSLLNSNGEVTYTEGKDPEITGGPTEMAILKWGIKLGANFDKVKCESTILYVDAFNSSKKRMGMVIKKNSGPVWVHWKGATEVILAKCNHFMDEDGSISSLTKEKLEELEGVISAFASAALRTICMACRDVSKDDLGEYASRRKSIQIPDDGLTCIAIIGIKDPCRPCAPEAVRRCQLAGIKVRMVTGDNIMTAKAIAAECGILTKTGTAIEGPDFRVMSPEEQYKILPSVDVRIYS